MVSQESDGQEGQMTLSKVLEDLRFRVNESAL